MDFIGKLISAPLGELVKSVGSVIDTFVTTDAEKLEAQRKLLELERNFQMKVLELEVDRAKTQAEVIEAETNSQSWLARSWRPILMLVFTFIIFNNYVLVPLFGLHAAEVPVQMWDLIKLGMGGYIFGRSAEKVVETAAPAFAAAFKK